LPPEGTPIPTILKAHIDGAVEELGVGHNVTVQGRFDKTPIHLEIEVTSKDENSNEPL
jgi:hypothetical protein